METTTFDWSCKHTWRQSAKNTAWCLLGCSIGDFGTILFFQLTKIPFPVLGIMILAIINGLITSIILETIILIRQNLEFNKALKTALGMSFISMISMETTMNLTDYFLTGGAILTWWVVPLMLIVGFLTPWPYNYWRLKNMASTVIKNWDNKTWLSSENYINSFNNFLIKNIKINSRFKILDIGCGRGKILGSLSSKLKLKEKPLGIDIVNHKDKDKRINFKKTNVLELSLKNNEKFDLILIKQTIHLIKFNEIKKLLKSLKKNLNSNGRILIFTLDTKKNEIPTFKLMKQKLNQSLQRDKKILKIITKLYPKRTKKKFVYNVKIQKKKYLEMIENRYISTLIPLSKKQLIQGVQEINSKYKSILRFKDKLICIIL